MKLMKRQASLALFLLLFLFGVVANAQDSKKESQLRTVRGVVVDKSESPVEAAVVFLKNLRTNQVRSYIADKEGQFRFSGLDPNADYEVHAEKDGAKSQTRQASSFDNRKELVFTLKLDKKKD
jgi:Carboxypeptidase regulatory-like domain